MSEHHVEPENNLKALRKASGRTRADIAAEAHISLGLYAKLEDRTRPLRVEYIQALAKVFHTTPNEIISRAEIPEVGVIRGDGCVVLYANSQVDEATPDAPHEGRKVPTPPDGLTASRVALRVEGCAMGSFAPEGALIYYEDAECSPEDCLGRRAVVWSDGDDQPRIRTLFRGRAFGKYDALTPANVIEHDQTIRRACKLTWTKEPD